MPDECGEEAEGVLVTSLIAEVKEALVEAGVTNANPSGGLRVASVQLILEAVATRAAGTRISFRVPFIGTGVEVGGHVRRRDTHTIDITLIPPDQVERAVHGAEDVRETLVEAIQTIRTTMLSAAGGPDPWVLSAGTVDIAFGVTREGTISVGVEGELSNEATNTLRLTLVPACSA